MVQPAQHLKTELIDRVLELIRTRLPADKAATVARFAQQFYAHAPTADIVSATPDQMYGAAVALWQLAAQRTPGRPRIRVYNPKIDEHGWQTPHTVVEIVNDDMPFLVDSVTSALNQAGFTVHLVIHPLVFVERDAEGRLTQVFAAGDGPPESRPESFMHVTVDRQSSTTRLDEAHLSIEQVLDAVRAAVEDWPKMRARIAAMVPHLEGRTDEGEEAAEAVALLRWADNDHFTFLGYRAYRFDGAGTAAKIGVVPGSGLGILRDDTFVLFRGLRDLNTQPTVVQWFVHQPDLIRVTKANARSPVHRPVHLDVIFVKLFDAEGHPVGECVFAGLFTSVAYNRLVQEVPFLRRKVDRVMAKAGVRLNSHDGRALLHILGTLPRDELFSATVEELHDISLGVLALQDRQRIALFVRRDPFERFLSCLVYVPRERYDTELRRRFQAVLERAIDGVTSTFYTQISESNLARLHFIIRTHPGNVPAFDVRDIEAQLVEAARGWTDRLRDALYEKRGEEGALRLLGRYGNAFAAGYAERFNAETAVYDIERIEDVRSSNRIVVNLYRPLEANENELRFKIYHLGRPIPLSDVLPMLEHMDLKVITELPFEVQPLGSAEPLWIHDFEAVCRAPRPVDTGDVKDLFQEAFIRVWYGDIEDDSFNRLVLRAGLTWRQITVLRAQARYLRQAGIQFSLDYMSDTLCDQPAIARMIVDLFQDRFDPTRIVAEAETAARAIASLDEALEDVTNLDQDRILRRFVTLTLATLRTNYFQTGTDAAPKPYLSFKLDSQMIDELPLPRPVFEIFVYSPCVEAIHLRGGKVARGGIRWSDRREDFRTEVLGLMKAQMVKNAVIVPVGSKGGFVVKRPPPAAAGRDATQQEGIACYKTMMAGLLDLTDNLDADGHVVPPRDLVRMDADDPYLVVAADKGTATFSDIANGVAQDYGFWLGDAFASGGSAGYDHKKIGITARGAWESVKRHFREVGVDCQTEPFTCIGIGDMGGDVFGNGMVLSHQTRLVGAFNHLHIFIDPNPDAEASWKERERLFNLPRSTWVDYDAALISKGGGVFPRNAKSIDISPEMRELLELKSDRLTPNEVILAMLRAEVDLLYFGGIGTFVKASGENHTEVGDRINDALRVDADTLRCRIVGEGANLGMTQLARIQAAQNGIRLNTDAIDNSAGVDCSDHEVNIKIALGDVVARGDMTVKQRDQMLADMTDDVADLVLMDNYLQTQAVTIAEALGPEGLEHYAGFMRALERSGRLNRRVERLPDEDELLERRQDKRGFTRPELSVLLAYAKLALYDELLASDVPDDPKMAEDLQRYFPRLLRNRHGEAIDRHRLRREIIATSITNNMINRAGISFVRDMAEKTGLASSEITRSYIIVREAFDLRPLWRDIQSLDNQVPAASQTDMLADTVRLLEHTVAWFLGQGTQPLDTTAVCLAYKPGIKAVADNLDQVLAPDAFAALHRRIGELTRVGVPEDLAVRVAALPMLAQALDITQIARLKTCDVTAVATLYFSLGYRFGMEWLRERAAWIRSDTPWHKQAVAAIVDDLYAHQTQLCLHVLEGADSALLPEEVIATWTDSRRAVVDRAVQLLNDLRLASSVDLAMLAVANRHMRALFAG